MYIYSLNNQTNLKIFKKVSYVLIKCDSICFCATLLVSSTMTVLKIYSSHYIYYRFSILSIHFGIYLNIHYSIKDC